MKKRRGLLPVLSAGLCLLLCGCMRPVPELEEQAVVGSRSYIELSRETRERLDLAVESADGLTLAGEARCAGDQEQHKAYAYPDPRYPNLLIISIDDELRIFQLETLFGETDGLPELLAMYGLDGVNSVQTIRVSRQQSARKAELLKEITDKAVIDAFLDGLQAERDFREGPDADAIKYENELWYYLNLELSNGFTLPLKWTPSNRCIQAQGINYQYDKKTSAWLNANIP